MSRLETAPRAGYHGPMATLAPRKLTYADLVGIPPDPNRYEILEGELAMTPPPAIEHQRIVARLHLILARHVGARRLGEVILSPADVLLSRHDVLEPDLIFVSRRRATIVRKMNLKGAPDLVIEVLSPTTRGRDRGAKLRIYRDRGVGEYWMVDPVARTVEARDFSRGGEPRVFRSGQSVASPRLPGLGIRVADLFKP